MVYYVNEGSVYAIAIIFPVLCTICIALRFYTRKAKQVAIGADDYMSIVALFFIIACAVCMIYGDAEHTVGWHTPPADLMRSFTEPLSQRQKVLSIVELTFIMLSILGIGAIRMVFALLYLRIFGVRTYRTFRIANWILMGFIIAWTVTFFIAFLTECGTHLDAQWTSQFAYITYCPDTFKISFAMSFTDVFLDVALLLLPIVPVTQLNMATKQKLWVMALFALGIFSVAAGLTRLVLYGQVLTYKYGSGNRLFGLAGTSDPTGIESVGIWWTYMEMGVGLFVAQLPVLSGMFRGQFKNPLFPSALRSLASIFSNSSRNNTQRSHKDSYENIELGQRSTGSNSTAEAKPGHDDEFAANKDGITVKRTYDVESNSVNGGSSPP